jgi:N-acetylglutamate synthase
VLGTGDVGHRVVVRRFVGIGQAGRPIYSDLLGELIAIGDDHLLVRSEDGSEHVVAGGDVAAAKRVPPRPARYSEIARVERVADEAWPTPVHERLGDWLLRAAEGWTNRANSALPLGDAGRPIGEAIDACAAWYDAVGLTPRITVPLPLRRDVAAALAQRAWRAQPPVLVQTVELPEPADPAGVRLEPTPSRDFLALVAARKRSLPAVATRILTGPAEVRFAEIRGGDGTLVAIARGALAGQRRWLHLGLVEVAPAQRRRGLARRVSLALMSWARERGATRALLQVEEHNAAAVALYAGLGFSTHHRYVTYARTEPP